MTLRDLRAADDVETILPPIVRQGDYPVLGAAKTGRAVFGRPSELIVLTDAYTIAGLEVEEIPRLGEHSVRRCSPTSASSSRRSIARG